jgi:PadR family transcriptional regulator PadR
MSKITRFEEFILLSVWKLGSNAYGPSICDYIQDITGKQIAIGGIYFPLKRLEKDGLLEAYQSKPTAVRGGQSKRYYRLTKPGLKVLLRELEIQQAFWKDLPELNNL